jgi:hypothetical protein
MDTPRDTPEIKRSVDAQSRRRSWSSRLKHILGDVESVIALLWLISGIGLASLFLPAGAKALQDDWSGALIVVGSGLFLAGGAVLVGAFVGFLFGVPRRRESDESRRTNGNSTGQSEGYRPNTNLEQISDWLTKIIVGVGLTQIPAIVQFFEAVGTNAGPAFGQSPAGEVIAISIVVHYLFVGFFQGFLLAYLWLPGAFVRATGSFETDKTRPATMNQMDKNQDVV